ncbi:MAG: hypothetical protein LUG52_03150 [Clostridia bacterium]|nr:hypothetical protein [Clostridia bacterium]
MRRFLSVLMCGALLLAALPAGAAEAVGENDMTTFSQYTEDENTIVYVDFDGDLPSGSVNNGVTFSDDGVYGKAGVFDGSSYIQLPDDITVGVTDFTMAAWVKFDATTSWQRVLDFGNGTSNFAFLGIAAASNLRGSVLNSNNGEEKLSSADSALSSDVWTHIAMVQSGSTRTLYLNGEAVHTLDVSYTLDAMGSTTQNYIGRSQFSADPYLTGMVDEVILANTAMSADEIADLAEISENVLLSYVDLGDTSEVESDLTLPTEANGASVTWVSADESIITSEGVITRDLEDKTTTLTATITLGSVSVTKEFEVTVKAMSAFSYEFANADSIKENAYLPSEIDGATLVWTSSDESVISTEEIQNGDYVIPAGVVTRGEEDQVVTLTAEITYGNYTETKEYKLTVKAAPEELGEMGGYLYAYFRGSVNGSDEVLSIHIAASEDGYNWFDLNGNWPILESTMGTTGLRDPYLIRSKDGDRFYLIATDLNTLDGQGWAKWSLEGSKYLMIWESDDLIDWSEQRMVKFANDDMGCAWAPEAIWDEDTQEYLVYAAAKDLTLGDDAIDTVYVVRTRDFTTFSEPEYFVRPYNSSGTRIAAIDSTIIKGDDGKYYQFYKKYNNNVYMMVSDHASGPYEEVASYNLTSVTGEGPAIYKVNGTENTYCLCIDNYSEYVPYLTDDLASGVFTKATADVVMPTGSKHGGFLPVTVEEYERLLEKWGPKGAESEDGASADFTYDFETEGVGTLYGNAAIEYSEERGSNVLTLDGTTGTYWQFPENLFDQKDTFTLSFDVKTNETTTKDLMTFTIGPDSDKYFFFKVNPTSMRAAITNASWSTEEAAAVSNMDDQSGVWMHIDLVVTPDKIEIYKDGEKVAATEDVTKTITHLGLENVAAYFGKSTYSADAYFNGEYDNIELYYRALSEAELSMNARIEDAAIADDVVSCTVAAKEEMTGKMIVSEYDAGGILLTIATYDFTAEVGDTAFTAAVSNESESVKLMFWSDVDSIIAPYAECAKADK